MSCLPHEGSMIGVQCQLIICKGHVAATWLNFSRRCGPKMWDISMKVSVSVVVASTTVTIVIGRCDWRSGVHWSYFRLYLFAYQWTTIWSPILPFRFTRILLAKTPSSWINEHWGQFPWYSALQSSLMESGVAVTADEEENICPPGTETLLKIGWAWGYSRG